ncbi:HAUS augmin-like complex subunit 6 [Harpia harpyja]|uniref:HAUS augmin-like complex subunit 6 n=1 Tax=Harpia harpyja TaxID=202280 RepID=UPI0022B176C6|nr:HAUS augmin-like complex subunit 6 [Harpia harpyja]
MCVFHRAENKAFRVLLVTLYNKVVLCHFKRPVKMQRSVGFLTTSDVAVYLRIRNALLNPRSSMFHLIAYFLFAKLDWSRAAEIFRHGYVPSGKIADHQFGRQCFMWLQEIAKEERSCLPQVTPSSLTVAGPKFIHLAYRFARHVLVEDLKRNSVGTGIPFAEAVKLRPKDVYLADARCRVAYNKLLQIFQKEAFVIQEYEKKAQLLMKEIEEMKSEYAVLQTLSQKMKQNDRTKNDRTERIQKVCSMWTLIMEMLTSLKKEKEAVDSVLEDCAGQCVLDGTNVAFSVPQLLAHRVESDIQQFCTGSVYEAEKLNFLTVIQLLNEALRTLRDEHCQCGLKQLQVIDDRSVLSDEVLQHLAAMRLKKQQRCMSASGPISKEQEGWEEKWKSFLGLCPFNLVLAKDPELQDLLGALSPHSFNVAEEDDEDSVPCQHLVSLSDVFYSIHEVPYQEDAEALEAMTDESEPPPGWISSVPLELSKASENRDVLIEKNLHSETCKGEEKPEPPNILKNGKDESAISEVLESAGDCVLLTESPVKKEDPLQKARDELAEEVAKTVVSELPQSGEGKGMALEDLISSLSFNPFLVRKEIPRTPENLSTEISSSRPKAVQTEGSSDTELAPTEVMLEEAPMDARPIMQKPADSRFMCSILASPVPDCDPPLSDRNSQVSSTEFRPQEQISISHIIESPVLETSGKQESERTEAQELKCIVLNKSAVEDPEEETFQYVNKSMNAPDTCSENNNVTNVLPSDHFQGSLVDGMLHSNLFPFLSSISSETGYVGILDETLPKFLDLPDPDKSVSSESDFDVLDSTYVTGGSENKEDIQKSKLDLQSLLNTHKELKKTVPGSEEELHQTHNGDETVSGRSDRSLAPEKRGRDGLCSPLELFRLDEEFTKTSSPRSLERKYSLLLASCQHLQEMASRIHEIPLDLMQKLKQKEGSNEKSGTEEPSSG